MHPSPPGVLVGGGRVLVVRTVVGLVVGLAVVCLVVVCLVVVCFVVVDLVVVGLVVVGLGVSVFVGRGGLVPPTVGVFIVLPSQYIVGPSNARFFSIVLIPAVPCPVQLVPFGAAAFSGGYSMCRTGFPAARKEA